MANQYLQFVLIDTWWNVNASVTGSPFTFLVVLIDTWWNVNYGKRFEEELRKAVLIDTWWNVNEAGERPF